MPGKNITIVLATYNGAKYITKQMDSIFAQALQPAEIIICDDRSTDNTVTLLDPYLKDSRVKIFINDATLGPVNNFKKASQLATPGNWLAFADQDDIWGGQKLSRLSDEMSKIDDGVTPALVFSDLSVIDRNDNITSSSFWGQQGTNPAKIRLSTLLYGNVALGCTMLINYAMAHEFFAMDNADYFHDEWLALIAYSFGKVKVLDEQLVLYRQHEGNVTFSEDYKMPGFFFSLKESLSYFFGRKKFLSRHFDLAKVFLLKYESKLDASQATVIKNFIAQENKHYLLQRLNRKIIYNKALS